MTTLILYATIEGQTGKVARFVKERAEALGQAVTCVDIGDPMASVSFADVERVILAASVHERRHPMPFEVFVQANRDQLARFPTLMLSVSLKAAFPEGLGDAEDFLREMEMRVGWEADRRALVAGAVRATSYDYFEQQVLQHVVLEGHDITVADGPHEFTDWDALVVVVDAFLQDV